MRKPKFDLSNYKDELLVKPEPVTGIDADKKTKEDPENDAVVQNQGVKGVVVSPQANGAVATPEDPPMPKTRQRKKKSLGRPKKEVTRKQYTITMLEEDYKKAMDFYKENGLSSLSMLIERALRAYMNPEEK